MRKLSIPVLTLFLILVFTTSGNGASLKKAQDLLGRGDFVNLVIEWKPFAEQGDVSIQRQLGHVYRWGAEGVPLNYTEAAKWYRMAAEQGDEWAQFYLGGMYQNGLGVAQDYSESLSLFLLAAKQGNRNAQNSVGVTYEWGQGVPLDNGEAARWYRLAAEQGLEEAQFNLGWLYNHGGNGVALDYEEALKWYLLAAEQGNLEAQGNLGNMYFNGQGVLQDYVRAHMWWNIAAAQGHTGAAEYLPRVTSLMIPSQIAEAQSRAATCVENEYRNC